jgi:hypothetical protein
MYLAHILVPEGFDEHPEARYPMIINHGHFYTSRVSERRRPDLKPDYSRASGAAITRFSRNTLRVL